MSRTKGEPARQGVATVPEPEQPAMKTCLVVGKHAYRGHRPGTTFRAVLDAALERAVQRGSIQIESDELARLNRDELNDVARQSGVPEPEGLPNKQAVIDAITATDQEG